jgi:hypothetical protein
MAAGVILAVSTLGALAALSAASSDLRQGQVRQNNSQLLAQQSQSLVLMDKTKFINDMTVVYGGTLPTNSSLSSTYKPYGGTTDLDAAAWCTSGSCTGPWKRDPSLNAGGVALAYFTVGVNGAIAPTTTPTWCGDPAGGLSYSCREVAVVNEGAWAPSCPGTAVVCPVTSTATIGTRYSVWTRVRKSTSPLSSVITTRDQFVTVP